VVHIIPCIWFGVVEAQSYDRRHDTHPEFTQSPHPGQRETKKESGNGNRVPGCVRIDLDENHQHDDEEGGHVAHVVELEINQEDGHGQGHGFCPIMVHGPAQIQIIQTGGPIDQPAVVQEQREESSRDNDDKLHVSASQPGVQDGEFVGHGKMGQQGPQFCYCHFLFFLLFPPKKCWPGVFEGERWVYSLLAANGHGESGGER